MEGNSSDELVRFDKQDFNIFKYFDSLNREQAFCGFLHTACEDSLQQLPQVKKETFSLFIRRVHEGYIKFNVTYHNDLHAIDVCQMTLVLLNGGVSALGQLSSIDMLATLLGAACHDLEHDGLSNPFHKNAQTNRFEEFGDKGTQEQYHLKQTRIILDETGLLSALSEKDRKHF